MKPSLLRCLCLALTLLAFVTATYAADMAVAPAPAAKSAKPAEFLIVLRLTPKYHDPAAWTQEADQTVGAHFVRLKEAAARGQVILAGRTTEDHDKTMGLVIFTADDEAAARKFMEEDPCVVAGIMSATLHPYSVAILRK